MAMALMDFIKKQFIDILEWNEDTDGVLAWRFPMEDREIQTGASLTVRESQMAVFVNEGTVADVFGPGRYKLTTQTLPVLTYLRNWDKLFESPFKSDVWFFSTRQQIDRRWGTAQPVSIRDKDFGACASAPSATTATGSPIRSSSSPSSPGPASATPSTTPTGSCAA
jgi:membrane protease subunit (stomatin/prohibitin family)